MRKRANKQAARKLPLVIVATAIVVGLPIGLVARLAAAGTVTSTAALTVIAAVAAAITWVGCNAIWTRIEASRDLLFGELMIWGWARRVWAERRLAQALETIDAEAGDSSADPGARIESFERLGTALEAADPYTHGHSRRVARYSVQIAHRLELSAGEVARIRAAAAIHDVGKVNTPIDVLHKPGPLTDEEFEAIKQHAVDGAEMVSSLEDPVMTGAVLHHHERLDGSGYPDGLEGQQIPLAARIIAVADCFDALTSTRPYRRASTRREGVRLLRSEAGVHLDPRAVEAFTVRYRAARPGTALAAMTTVTDRVVAAMGGAFNTASASVAGIAVATVAAFGVTVANPGGVAEALRSVGGPLPAIAEVISPRGDSDNSDQPAGPAEPRRASAQAAPASSGSRGSGPAGREGAGGDGSSQPQSPPPGGLGVTEPTVPAPAPPSGGGNDGGSGGSGGSGGKPGDGGGGGGSTPGDDDLIPGVPELPPVVAPPEQDEAVLGIQLNPLKIELNLPGGGQGQ